MQNNKTEKLHFAYGSILIFAIVMAIWGACFWFVEKYVATKPDSLLVGDAFAALNTLFSGLAFAGLICAIFLQKSELSLQRNELELTRNELSGQREQLELQNKTLNIQTFENTFFQLLRSHNDIVSSIDLVTEKRITKGRDCMKVFFERYKKERIAEKIYSSLAADPLAAIEKTYIAYYPKIEGELGHYFRSLYNIVKFIHFAKIEEDSKRLYTNLIRAQLSKFELLLIFYNCLSSKGREKFKPLVEHYALLKMVNGSDLVLPDTEYNLYHLSAYGYPLPNR